MKILLMIDAMERREEVVNLIGKFRIYVFVVTKTVHT